MVAALTISPSEILCESPPAYSRLGDSVGLELAKNAVDFTSDGTQFHYTADVVLLDISPTTAPLGGGIPVILHGSGFLDTPQLACRFGMMPSCGSSYIQHSHRILPRPFIAAGH